MRIFFFVYYAKKSCPTRKSDSSVEISYYN